MVYFRLLTFIFLSATAQAQTIHDSIDQVVKELRGLAAEDPAKATSGLLNTKKKSEEIRYNKGIMHSSYTLMLLYYNGGQYGKVIEESSFTEAAAKVLMDNQYLFDVHRMRAISYDEMALGNEALKELDKASVYINKIASLNNRFYKKALLYESYAGVFNKKRDFHKEIDYRYKSIAETSKIAENNADRLNAKYHNFALQYASLGLAYKEVNEKDSSLKYFEKALSIYENEKYDIYINGKATLLSDMAIFYYENKEYVKCIQFAKKAERYEKQTSLPYIRRDIYRSLFNAYSEVNKSDSAKYYLNLHTAINDSLLKTEKESLYTPVNQIISDKESEKKQYLKTVIIWAVLASVALFLMGWRFWRRKNQHLQKNYEKLVEKLKHSHFSADEPIEPEMIPENEMSAINLEKEKGLRITDSTLHSLLKKLDKFEKSDTYLKKDINLNYLANLLGANHRYVSEVIKKHKEKTFSNYINDLKIDHITNLLYKEPKYREYKISYLAEACGFSSREVFAAAFKKRTGIPPSYFIENLNKAEWQSNCSDKMS